MPLPIPKLDSTTFQEFFEESRALIPRYMPGWTEHNFSDPGITLIDLLAWLADMQGYYLDRITEQNFLKFLKLVGEAPFPAQPARVGLTFSTDNPPTTIQLGTQVAATEPKTGERIIFETEEPLTITSLVLERLFTQSGRQKINHTVSNTEGIFYLPLGENPTAGDRFYLGFNAAGDFPGEEIALTVNVFNGASTEISREPEGGSENFIPSAKFAWEYWDGQQWQAFQVQDGTAAFMQSGRIRFSDPGIRRTNDPWPGEPLYWIRAGVKTPGYEIPPRLDTIRLHTVLATHGETVRNRIFSGNGLPFQTLALKFPPVLANTLVLEIKDREGSWNTWQERADFDASGPEDTHYRLDLLKGVVSFGDGIHGAIPPAGEQNIRVKRYRSGGGEKGNLARVGMITEIVSSGVPEGITVMNYRAAAGGRETEDIDAAKSRVRRDFKERRRAITSPDYETLAKETPGLRIARLKVLPEYHPQFPAVRIPGAVTVVVVPEILPEFGPKLPQPSVGFLDTVRRHLQPRTLLTTNLHVIGPDFVKVEITTDIRVDPHRGAETIRGNVEEALNKFLNPLESETGEKGWPFGRAIFKSEIFQVIEGVKGVTCVDQVYISAKGCGPATESQIPIRKIALVYSGKHNIRIKI